MKFKLTKTSDRRFDKEIEINSLDDLKKISKEYDEPLVIFFDDVGENIVEVYDDYRE